MENFKVISNKFDDVLVKFNEFLKLKNEAEDDVVKYCKDNFEGHIFYVNGHYENADCYIKITDVIGLSENWSDNPKMMDDRGYAFCVQVYVEEIAMQGQKCVSAKKSHYESSEICLSKDGDFLGVKENNEIEFDKIFNENFGKVPHYIK